MPDGATIDISEARRQFNSLDARLSSERIIYVTRHNKNAFAVVDTEFLGVLLETIEIMSDKESFRLFCQSVDDIKYGRVFEHEDVERDLG